MTTAERLVEEGRIQGRAEGRRAERLRVAWRALSRGWRESEIAVLLGVTTEKVHRLIAEATKAGPPAG